MQDQIITKTAYLAGLIDGEGYLGFHKRRATERIAMVDFAISNTNVELMNWLHENFGGKIYWVQRRKPLRHENRPIDYTWMLLKNAEIYTVLKSCLCFLVIKKKRVELALQFLESKKNPDIDLVTKFYEPMKLLNNPLATKEGQKQIHAKLKEQYTFPLKVETAFERIECRFCGHSWIPRPNTWRHKEGQTKPLKCPNCQALLEPNSESKWQLKKNYVKWTVGATKN